MILALQFKMCSDQVQKLAEDRFQSLATLENTQKKLLDVRKSSQQLRESLERSQSKVEKSRVGLVGLQIDLEKERYYACTYFSFCFLLYNDVKLTFLS